MTSGAICAAIQPEFGISQSTRAAVDSVITAQAEQRRNSTQATSQRRRSQPS